MAPGKRQTVRLLTALLALSNQVFSLQVTPNSPCAAACIDSSGADVSDPGASNTYNSDIICEDRLFGSNTGSKWKNCMGCLQNSTFVNGGENDQSWFLYNMRYSLSNCIFSFPNASNAGSTPCSTSTACGALQDAFEQGIPSSGDPLQYEYCSADGGDMTGPDFPKCLACVSAGGDTNILANYVSALNVGCLQQPAPGKAISLNGSIFSSSMIGAQSPSTPSSSSGGGISTGVIAGIVAGAIVIILLIAVLVFCRYHRRKNRQNRAVSIGPDGGWRWGIGARPQSDLSFQCRSDRLSPTFTPAGPGQLPGFPEKEMMAAQQQQHYGPETPPAGLGLGIQHDKRTTAWKTQNPVGAAARAHGTVSPVPEEPPYFAPPPQQKQPEGASKGGSKLKAGAAKRTSALTSALPLHSLTTSLPTMPSAVQSPPSRASPLSASSARSTTALLPHHGSSSSSSPFAPYSPYSPSSLGGGFSGSFASAERYVPPVPPPKSPRHGGGIESPVSATKTTPTPMAWKDRGAGGVGSPVDNRAIQTAFPPPPKR